MKYTASQIAKALAAAVTGLSGVAVGIATAATDGISGDEWAVIIPLVSSAILTVLAVFTVPNGLEGDK